MRQSRIRIYNLISAAACLIVALICAACATSPALSQPLPQQFEPGRKIYLDRCTRCHEALSPEEFTRGQWKKCVSHYGPRAGLTAEETPKLLAFLQAYAEDANAP